MRQILSIVRRIVKSILSNDTPSLVKDQGLRADLSPVEVVLDTSAHVLRARRTAAVARASMALIGIGLLLAQPGLARHPELPLIGFAVIAVTSLVQLGRPLAAWLRVEEAVSCLGGTLIVGLSDQRVNVLTLLWLGALAAGVLARGGRHSAIGRAMFIAILI